jgi:hypothetical protein
MRLDELLDRSAALEERTARLYTRFAAAPDPDLAPLWAAMAREEEGHADAVRGARAHLAATTGWQTRIDGWTEALDAIEHHLAAAEALGPDATSDQRLAAAIDLEATEIEPLRRIAIHATGERLDRHADADHLERLTQTALRISNDPHVRVTAMLLLNQARLGRP